MRRTRAINDRTFALRRGFCRAGVSPACPAFSQFKQAKRPHHNGFSLIEVVAAAAVLGIAATLTAQLVLNVTDLRRTAREHQIAREEVANALEQFSLAPWESLSPERAKRITASSEARRAIPSGELAVEIAPVSDEPDTRRLMARFTWRNRRGEPQPAVQAVAWVSRSEAAP